MSTSKAMQSLESDRAEIERDIEVAKVTRKIGGSTVTYGQCSTTCGTGQRVKISAERVTSEEELSRVKDSIECTELSGCQWRCSHARSCGWGKITCHDADGSLSALNDCKYKTGLQWLNFPSKRNFKHDSCFKQCNKHNGLASMCNIAVNHLDKQYKTLSTLVERTCLSGQPQHPDIITVATQELNHANRISDGPLDFNKYVNDTSLQSVQYVKVGSCAAKLSANSAVFVKSNKQHLVFAEKAGETRCSGTDYRSTCDWTNCKGSSVMAVETTSGWLVLGSMHLARAGTSSNDRVDEVEHALQGLSQQLPASSANRKTMVFFGGDINTRSDFGSKDHQKFIASEEYLDAEHSGNEVWKDVGGDILGHGSWTVDQHMSGAEGFSQEARRRAKALNLKAAKGFENLCPTYRKSKDAYRKEKVKKWDGAYEKGMFGFKKKVMVSRTVAHPNLKCRTPADQLASGVSTLEYHDMEKPFGDKSRSPSWTMRIFLSEPLQKACGKVIKDIRNAQDDHDPLFVHCDVSMLS